MLSILLAIFGSFLCIAGAAIFAAGMVQEKFGEDLSRFFMIMAIVCVFSSGFLFIYAMESLRGMAS